MLDGFDFGMLYIWHHIMEFSYSKIDDTTKKFIAALQEKQVDPFEIDADIAEEYMGEE